jgi:FkbM family methyltransferase
VLSLAGGGFVRGGAFAEQGRFIIKEIHTDDVYELGKIPTTGDATEFVVDVGAHIGVFTSAWKDRNPNARVFCVEPSPRNAEVLELNVEDKASIIQGAVWYGREVVHFYEPNRDDCYGFMGPPGKTHDGFDDTGPVQHVTLEDILDTANAARIDLLKLDCEGGEFEIFEKCTCLNRIRRMIGEWHDRERFFADYNAYLSGWNLRVIRDSSIGIFYLENPCVS